MGYFEIHNFLGKTIVDSFWATFRRNWATFYSAMVTLIEDNQDRLSQPSQFFITYPLPRVGH